VLEINSSSYSASGGIPLTQQAHENSTPSVLFKKPIEDYIHVTWKGNSSLKFERSCKMHANLPCKHKNGTEGCEWRRWRGGATTPFRTTRLSCLSSQSAKLGQVQRRIAPRHCSVPARGVSGGRLPSLVTSIATITPAYVPRKRRITIISSPELQMQQRVLCTQIMEIMKPQRYTKLGFRNLHIECRHW
jgi:hypothetical protein